MDTTKPPKDEAPVGAKKLEEMPQPISQRQQRALDKTAGQPGAKFRVLSLDDLALPGEALSDDEFDDFMSAIEDSREKSVTKPPKL